MSNQQSESLSRIAELQAQIAQLQNSAVSELKAKRADLVKQLADVDAELAKLTGAPVERKSARAKGGPGRSLPLQDLKSLLEAAPDKTLNVRKEGLELANIKTLATANPHLLKIGGKGAWPTVTLLK